MFQHHYSAFLNLVDAAAILDVLATFSVATHPGKAPPGGQRGGGGEARAGLAWAGYSPFAAQCWLNSSSSR